MGIEETGEALKMEDRDNSFDEGLVNVVYVNGKVVKDYSKENSLYRGAAIRALIHTMGTNSDSRTNLPNQVILDGAYGADDVIGRLLDGGVEGGRRLLDDLGIKLK